MQFYNKEGFQFLKNAKGQVAIFVVLIFQVLFILFAMTINIAMVTFDKINMQNSLDLAAYYGAKKQAEVLNAMAHINYQMRQNWKLLAWRYRILGTLIQPEGGRSPAYWCPQNANNQFRGVANNNCVDSASQPCRSAQTILNPAYGNSYCDAFYFVCISHNLWKRGILEADQNLCNKSGVDIPEIVDLEVVTGSWMPEAMLAKRGVDYLQNEINKSCPAEGALNWLMTQFFLTHFRLDQKDRKIMIEELYNKTLKEGKDLDGENIFEGAKKVFCGNLSQANRKNAQQLCQPGSEEGWNIFNSFDDIEFKEVFKKLNVWPVLQFIKDKSIHDNACNVERELHYNFNFNSARQILDKSEHSLHQYLTPEVGNLFKLNSRGYFHQAHVAPDPLRELTLAFFKDKEQTLYYGLKAEYKYLSQNQVFSLSLSPPITFKASAFAKAFGGNFGPQPEQSDPLIPVHPVPNHPYPPSSPIPNSNKINPVLLQPNHSRFPGDKWGLIDRNLHDRQRGINFLNKHSTYNKDDVVYSMEDYFHLTLYAGSADDPLARRDPYNPYFFTRMIELMAVYPDLYDISYYSILGNYHQTYFKKICKLLRNGSECDPSQRNDFNSPASHSRKVYIRGDFGWPDTDSYLKKKQQEKSRELSIAPYFLKIGRNNVDKNLIPPSKLWETEAPLFLPDGCFTPGWPTLFPISF